ncbi:MAG: hypothetical protein HY722_09360 [Planctomycetes bacterium]|nr:hypothetical protein [Planctomycetota bacterium]
MTPRERRAVQVVAGLAGALVAVFEAFAWYVPHARAGTLAADVDRLGEDAALYRRRKEERPLLEQKRDAVEAVVRQYVRILPDERASSEEEVLRLLQAFLDEASRVGPGTSHLELQSFAADKTQASPADPSDMGTAFRRYGYTVQLRGTFFQFLTFVSLLENHERFFRVNGFHVTPGESMDDPGSMAGAGEGAQAFEVRFSTYTYQSARGGGA